MPSPSNLYAEKIFAEHPLGLWALDDVADYVSLIDENTRDISSWSVSGGSAELSSFSEEPFPSSHVSKLTGDVTNEDGQISCISDFILNFSDLDQDLGTFSIGTYFYADSSYIAGYQIGYQYYDTTTGSVVERLQTFQSVATKAWVFTSSTFAIPNENTEIKLVIKVDYIGGASDSEDNVFYVNGLSFGQWSEEFNSTSLGVNPTTNSSTSIGTLNVISAEAYGVQETPGYYVSNSKSLFAKNTGVPLVFGASSNTKLTPNENGSLPSLIVPGFGVMNDHGKGRDYSVEFWARINSNSTSPFRIFGPIASADGLYVDGPFLVFKINNKISSHYVGEWYRPMLFNINIIPNNASIILNGEPVISIDLQDDVEYPSKFSEAGKDQDWLGFYVSEQSSPIEIDAIAIYPYKVPVAMAKRRWVYGQAVEFPENINTAYSGTSTAIDYSFANYTNNYSYPDLGSWGQGVVENLITDRNILSTPSYNLPSILFDNKLSEDWIQDLGIAQNESSNFISLRPNQLWNDTNGHIYFDSFNLLNQETKAFYGVFKLKQAALTEQVLFRVDNENTGDYFTISVLGTRISYKLKYGQAENVIYEAFAADEIGDDIIGDEFAVGLHIDRFSEHFGGRVASFFGNKSQLKVYVGGTKSFSNTFAGNIYKVGFCTARNLSKVQELFSSNGATLDYENVFLQYGQQIDVDGGSHGTSSWDFTMDGGMYPWQYTTRKLTDHIASYTLVSHDYLDEYSLDIAVDSYWEDYIPLSYFAKFVEDSRGDSMYDLDFIQFNINYPAPSRFVQEETSTGSWNYQELQSEYSNPIQRTYESLDNHLFTGFDNYQDLKNKSSKSYKFDTSMSEVKTYITFQYLEAGANAVDGYFINKLSAPKDRIVKPGPEWVNTKYEVVDHMIIYPPSGVDFNDLAIVTHLEFEVDKLIKKPVKIRSLQYASQALSQSSPNPIGTKFGVPMYPYKKNGVYYDYKGDNPFIIYKGSTPYLYLTRYSGIRNVGQFDPMVNRGLSIPVNTSLSSEYKVIAMQAFMRYDEDFFPYAQMQIFEIQSKNSYIKFFLKSIDPNGQRAKLYAINANTGQLENGIGFYLNGRIVKDPVITVKEWNVLGIAFANTLDFSNYLGGIRINGPLTFNNVSHYQSTSLQEVQQVSVRPWFAVRRAGPITLDWEFWNTSYNWNGVLILSDISNYGVSPQNIYQIYTGTNKIIIDDTRSDTQETNTFNLNSYQYNFYQNVSWQSQVLDAV
jgi:hypothetical protein